MIAPAFVYTLGQLDALTANNTVRKKAESDMSNDCVFCGILSGEIESSVVAEDEYAFAFMDKRPINAGHVLVVPRRHSAQLSDLSEDEAANVFRLVHRVASALPKSGIRCEGYRLSQANGAAAGQEVFHVHFHVVPRFRGDAERLVVDPNRPRFGREELNRCANSIAAAMIEAKEVPNKAPASVFKK
jgi:diadenosine tetraphosphate (Ap4A) HIT family hydrolase